jgi:hypothetical protein
MPPPNYMASQVIGSINGRSPIGIARLYGERTKLLCKISKPTPPGGRNIKKQQAEDHRLEQLKP